MHLASKVQYFIGAIPNAIHILCFLCIYVRVLSAN